MTIGYHAIMACQSLCAWRNEAKTERARRARGAELSHASRAGQWLSADDDLRLRADLRHQPELAKGLDGARHLDRVRSRFIPAWEKKRQHRRHGQMTEKQGGSDVRANTTKAYPSAQATRAAVRTGRSQMVFPRRQCVMPSWCSRTSSRHFLFPAAALSRPTERKTRSASAAEGQLGGLVQRELGSRIQGAVGWMIAKPGRGVRPRFWKWSALTAGLHDWFERDHAPVAGAGDPPHAHRKAFGKLLSEQPLMQNVLATSRWSRSRRRADPARLARHRRRAA